MSRIEGVYFLFSFGVGKHLLEFDFQYNPFDTLRDDKDSGFRFYFRKYTRFTRSLMVGIDTGLNTEIK